MKRKRIRRRFKVVEYASYYAVRDLWSPKEREHAMSDGVDCLFTKSGKAMRPGTEYFRLAWERALNENPSETAEAYFS
jgi:hypothetical protein